MKKLTLNRKFAISIATIMIVSTIILSGNRLLGKAAFFHYLERMHLENVMLMDHAFVLAEQEAKNSNMLRRADVLGYIDTAIALGMRAESETSYGEKLLFRLLGFDSILDLPAESIQNHNRIRAALIAAPGNGISAELALQVRPMRLDILKKSQQFTTLVLEAVDFIKATVYTLGALAVIVLGLLIYLLRQSTLPPIAKALDIARKIAQGDLTGKIETGGHDEFGELLQALQTMQDNLANIVGEVRKGTDTFSSVSCEIAAGNADLSIRTEAQAGSIEETASSIEALTQTVGQNAENAMRANELVLTSSAVAQQGGTMVSEVVTMMNAIKESSRNMTEIISVIDAIAFQTNILALNAAVEAARAGKQGRGFAVVASEVRTLAQRSANAAKEIKALIQNSVEKIEAGSTLVDEAGQTMSEVVSSVSHAASLMGEIAAASREQSAGIEQVNTSIDEMDRMTQQNAALVEQANAAAASLQHQAEQLARKVRVFKLDNETNLPILLLRKD